MVYVITPILFLESFFVFFSLASNELDDLLIETAFGVIALLTLFLMLATKMLISERINPDALKMVIYFSAFNLLIIVFGFWDVFTQDFEWYLREWKYSGDLDIRALSIFIYTLASLQVSKMLLSILCLRFLNSKQT